MCAIAHARVCACMCMCMCMYVCVCVCINTRQFLEDVNLFFVVLFTLEMALKVRGGWQFFVLSQHISNSKKTWTTALKSKRQRDNAPTRQRANKTE